MAGALVMPPETGAERRMAMTVKTKLLGQPTPLPASPDQAILDRVPNPHPETNYVARFAFPEFTSIDRKSTRLNSSHRCIPSFPTRRSSDLPPARLARSGDPRPRAEPPSGDELCRALCISGIHLD